MNYKRAILASLITYGITLVVGVVAAFGFGIGFTDTQNGAISPGTWIFGGLTSIFAAAIGSFWYFKKSNNEASVRTGFHLGLVIIIVSFILDWLTFLPVITDPSTLQLIQAYYGNAFFWIVVLIVLATTTGVGKYLETNHGKKENKKKPKKGVKSH